MSDPPANENPPVGRRKNKTVQSADGWSRVVGSSSTSPSTQRQRSRTESPLDALLAGDTSPIPIPSTPLQAILMPLDSRRNRRSTRSARAPSPLDELLAGTAAATTELPETILAAIEEVGRDLYNKAVYLRVSLLWSDLKARLEQIVQSADLEGYIKIKKVVILGLGSLMSDLRDAARFQLVLLEDICQVLDQAQEISCKTVFAQDPVFLPLDKKIFQVRNIHVLEMPEADKLIDDETFLYAPHLEFSVLRKVLPSCPAITICNDLEKFMSEQSSTPYPEFKAYVSKTQSFVLPDTGDPRSIGNGRAFNHLALYWIKHDIPQIQPPSRSNVATLVEDILDGEGNIAMNYTLPNLVKERTSGSGTGSVPQDLPGVISNSVNTEERSRDPVFFLPAQQQMRIGERLLPDVREIDDGVIEEFSNSRGISEQNEEKKYSSAPNPLEGNGSGSHASTGPLPACTVGETEMKELKEKHNPILENTKTSFTYIYLKQFLKSRLKNFSIDLRRIVGLNLSGNHLVNSHEARQKAAYHAIDRFTLLELITNLNELMYRPFAYVTCEDYSSGERKFWTDKGIQAVDGVSAVRLVNRNSLVYAPLMAYETLMELLPQQPLVIICWTENEDHIQRYFAEKEYLSCYRAIHGVKTVAVDGYSGIVSRNPDSGFGKLAILFRYKFAFKPEDEFNDESDDYLPDSRFIIEAEHKRSMAQLTPVTNTSVAVEEPADLAELDMTEIDLEEIWKDTFPNASSDRTASSSSSSNSVSSSCSFSSEGEDEKENKEVLHEMATFLTRVIIRKYNSFLTRPLKEDSLKIFHGLRNRLFHATLNDRELAFLLDCCFLQEYMHLKLSIYENIVLLNFVNLAWKIWKEKVGKFMPEYSLLGETGDDVMETDILPNSSSPRLTIHTAIGEYRFESSSMKKSKDAAQKALVLARVNLVLDMTGRGIKKGFSHLKPFQPYDEERLKELKLSYQCIKIVQYELEKFLYENRISDTCRGWFFRVWEMNFLRDVAVGQGGRFLLECISGERSGLTRAGKINITPEAKTEFTTVAKLWSIQLEVVIKNKIFIPGRSQMSNMVSSYDEYSLGNWPRHTGTHIDRKGKIVFGGCRWWGSQYARDMEGEESGGENEVFIDKKDCGEGMDRVY
ncbi:hypothetical protein RUND412_002581 [Rhizina undulata]